MQRDNFPAVTVITTTYNGEPFLAAAVESVLAQTLENFEYIIVDDASSDDTPNISARYAAADKRIRLLRCEKNLGPGGALNKGLLAARAPYVAILDHDDLAYCDRLAHQAKFLDEHPAIGVVGSAVDIIDESGQIINQDIRNSEPAHVRWEMLFSCDVKHSSACIRRNLLKQVGGYSAAHRYITDYELFLRLLDKTEITNISYVLGAYRCNPAQTSYTCRSRQYGQVLLLQFSIYRRQFDIPVQLEDVDALYRGLRGIPLKSATQVRQAVKLLDELYSCYVKKVPSDPDTMDFIRQDCAYKTFTIAHCNRFIGDDLYFGIMGRARHLDPDISSRHRVQTLLNVFPLNHAGEPRRVAELRNPLRQPPVTPLSKDRRYKKGSGK